jgi:hypothetical protein
MIWLAIKSSDFAKNDVAWVRDGIMEQLTTYVPFATRY